MKKLSTLTIILVMALTSTFGVPSTIISGQTNSNYVVVEYGDDIDLQGLLIDKFSRSGSYPIEVSLVSGSLSVHFNANLGDVAIEITNVFGVTVYSTFINSAVQNTVIIPTSGFVSGNYTITFSNNNGEASGNFNI